MRFLRYKSGWYGDNYRHSLAARGISSRRAFQGIPPQNDLGEDDLTVGRTMVNPQTGEQVTIMGKMPSGAFDPRALGKQRQLEALSKERALDVGGYTGSINRITAGNVEEATAAIGQWPDRKLQIQDAAVQGALSQARRGNPVDSETLRLIGVNQSRIDVIERERRKVVGTGLGARLLGAEKYSGETFGEAATGVAKATGMATLKGAETVTAVGLKNLRSEFGQPKESALDKYLREKREKPDMLEQNAGTFNTLGVKNAFFGGEEGAEDKKMRMYPEAIRADNEADSLFENRSKLAQINMSGFTEGNLAFKTGNRENLIAAITKLEAEHARVKDNWNIVQDARKLVLSPENRDQVISMEKDMGVMKNPLLSGFGGSKLDEETRKIAETERSIMNSSNLLSARIGMLRNKLKRLNSTIQAENTAPAKVKLVNDVQTSYGEASESSFRVNQLGDYIDSIGGGPK